jgi:hypothetical protein
MVPFAGAAATIAKVAGTVKDVVDKGKDSKGVYDLIIKNVDDLEQTYVGQSKNIFKRMKKHFGKRGKLSSAQDVLHGVTHKMPGSTKLEREIYEQFIILRKYEGEITTKLDEREGIFRYLLNKVNPVGGRYKIIDGVASPEFNKKALEIAKKYNLPTEFN